MSIQYSPRIIVENTPTPTMAGKVYAAQQSEAEWYVNELDFGNYFAFDRGRLPDDWRGGIIFRDVVAQPEKPKLDVLKGAAKLAQLLSESSLTDRQQRLYGILRHWQSAAPSPLRKANWWDASVAQLDKLANLRAGWDGAVADPPSLAAVSIAKRVLMPLAYSGLGKPRITPSVEGGIGIAYEVGSRYAFIECDNEGEVVVGLSDEADDDVWQSSTDSLSLQSTANKIAVFIRR